MYMHSVGLDKTHEMCINKESKTLIARPTKDNNMERQFVYFSHLVDGALSSRN